MRNNTGRYLTEVLESRRLLAAVSWDGGGDGINWMDPLNWSADALPGAGDDVTIDVPGSPTIRFWGGVTPHTINSLTCAEAFRMILGRLEIVSDSVISGPMTHDGGHLYGGTAGTSFHDVLVSAGLDDVAARNHRDWPAYASEDVLALDPEIIVTNRGLALGICRHPGFDRLRACQEAAERRDPSIVELDSALLGDPGLPMLDAAEAIYRAVYEQRELPSTQ